MDVYHEIDASLLQSVLSHGLKRTSRRAKGDDEFIIKTDTLLDSTIPKYLKFRKISRNNTIYGYVGTDRVIVDIKDGSEVGLEEKIRDSDHILLQLAVDPNYCYVADLDLYDRIKDTVKKGGAENEITALASSYWQKVIPFSSFSIGEINRPEVMITYNIPPAHIHPVTKIDSRTSDSNSHTT
jgi:hypothetical protein